MSASQTFEDQGTAIHMFPWVWRTMSTKNRNQVNITMKRNIVTAMDLYGENIMSIWSFAKPFWTSMSCAILAWFPFRIASMRSLLHARMIFCVRDILSQSVKKSRAMDPTVVVSKPATRIVITGRVPPKPRTGMKIAFAALAAAWARVGSNIVQSARRRRKTRTNRDRLIRGIAGVTGDVAVWDSELPPASASWATG